MKQPITNTYEHELAYHFHNIDMRGLLIDTDQKELVRQQVDLELQDNCNFLSSLWGFPCYIGRENAPKEKTERLRSLNVNSPDQLLKRLKFLGYDVPKVRAKNEQTDQYEMEDSVGKLALIKLLSDPNRWPSPNSGEGIKRLRDIKEVVTFERRYLNARLYKNIFYSSHGVTNTVTGRRGSKKNIYGLGGNDQNFPTRGRLAGAWKRCIIARKGRIFFFVDQISAEDWPVQALAANYAALDLMRKGVNRHYIFASQIFNIQIDDLKFLRNEENVRKGLVTTSQQEEAETKYYLGKKSRHANNYGLQAERMSESIAIETGKTFPKKSCQQILTIVDGIDPNVKRVFHQYIQGELFKPDHMLRTPLGRERQFLGIRQGEKNYTILNEGYAYIPQSTVGDNTGLAVCSLEGCNDYIVQDGHDSLCQELPDKEQELLTTFKNTEKAFTRDITFHNGITINIPIEGAIGYNWRDKIKLKEYTEDCLIETYRKLKKEQRDIQEQQENEIWDEIREQEETNV